MATSLERRVRVLEDAGGGGECPRCSGVFGTLLSGEFWSAGKHGEPMSAEEWEEFEYQEDEEGRCPICGQKPIKIRVGGL